MYIHVYESYSNYVTGNEKHPDIFGGTSHLSVGNMSFQPLETVISMGCSGDFSMGHASNWADQDSMEDLQDPIDGLVRLYHA